MWLEQSCGWNNHVVGTIMWLEQSCGQNNHVVGTIMWLEQSCGWNNHVVGTIMWLEHIQVIPTCMNQQGYIVGCTDPMVNYWPRLLLAWTLVNVKTTPGVFKLLLIYYYNF